ncbi:hypothetical protein FPCIR_11871 [Fusarium pseudocircinatum]|uniref:Uncharacterized protein n=1 Tax=Fusarium pseudocircinatum TaxID=56676 RepID=A0A8H5KR32_9HYPO|nr:hypothetical protein FPCIR_11871 [Fusarium pseudocircinatum]
MVNHLESTLPVSALGSWTEDLYARIFVQPDDQVSANTIKECIAEDFIAKINHDHYTRQSFHDIIMKFRIDNKTTIHETKELQCWDAPDGSGAGCVSQFLRFTDSNKETGVGSMSSTLLIASIKVVNGQKVLVELTEVMKASV